MILVMDTHAEEVFIGLWDGKKSGWQHHDAFVGGRQLNAIILQKLDLAFSALGRDSLTGVIVAAGPGSFTGLRIGISVGNTIAYTRDLPIVAPAETANADELLQKGLLMLESAGSQYDAAVVPFYGADPHITKAKR